MANSRQGKKYLQRLWADTPTHRRHIRATVVGHGQLHNCSLAEESVYKCLRQLIVLIDFVDFSVPVQAAPPI